MSTRLKKIKRYIDLSFLVSHNFIAQNNALNYHKLLKIQIYEIFVGRSVPHCCFKINLIGATMVDHQNNDCNKYNLYSHRNSSNQNFSTTAIEKQIYKFHGSYLMFYTLSVWRVEATQGRVSELFSLNFKTLFFCFPFSQLPLSSTLSIICYVFCSR